MRRGNTQNPNDFLNCAQECFIAKRIPDEEMERSSEDFIVTFMDVEIVHKRLSYRFCL